MKDIFLVGIGGFAGSVLRFKAATFFVWYLPQARFPWGTFVVNAAGCFLIGIIATALERASVGNAELRLLLITGFLGGFTTFSAFGLETAWLIQSRHLLLASLNIAGSLCIALAAVWCGMYLGARLWVSAS